MRVRLLLLSIPLIGMITSFCRLPEENEQSVTVVTADRISGPQNDVQSILRTGERIEQAFRDGNLDALMAEVSDDIVLISQNFPF